MKPVIFFIKKNDDDKVILSPEELTDLIMKAYESGLAEGQTFGY